ncbi:MAG: hypothetical protein ACPG8W_25990 [Candidatus Promineifilaceae bacterium]
MRSMFGLRQVMGQTHRHGIGWGLGFLVILLAIFPDVVTAQASETKTTLTIAATTPFAVGEAVALEATLRDPSGLPLFGEPVEIHVNSRKFGEGRTDVNGVVQFEIGNEWQIGEYAVQFVSVATADYDASHAFGQFAIRPIFLTITTVPPVPLTQFRIADKTYVSDLSGRVQIEIAQPGTYELEMLPPPLATTNRDRRVVFDGWSDGTMLPLRGLTIAQDEMLQAGFVLSYPVVASVVSAENQPLAVDQMALIAQTGELLTIDPTTPQFLPANTIARTDGSLVSVPITYVMADASINGQPLIETDSDPLEVGPATQWQFVAPNYTLRLRAQAQWFGSVEGVAFDLHYPDGHIETFAPDANGTVQLSNLLPGIYQVVLIGNLRSLTPIVVDLSRDQDVLVMGATVPTVAVLLLGLFVVTIGFGVTFYGYQMGKQRQHLKPPFDPTAL